MPRGEKSAEVEYVSGEIGEAQTLVWQNGPLWPRRGNRDPKCLYLLSAGEARINVMQGLASCTTTSALRAIHPRFVVSNRRTTY